METDHAVQPVVLTPENRREKVRGLRRRLRQFVEPFEVREPWWSWDTHENRWFDVPMGDHVTELPPLLDQIEASVHGVRGAAGSSGVFESRPTAALDAIDAMRHIGSQAAETVEELTRSEASILVASNLGRLEAVASSLADAELVALERKARSWWAHARIVAGFEEPAQRPHVKCPRCEAQDEIRLRLDLQGRLGIAVCRGCHATWTGDPGEVQRDEGAGEIRMLLREIARQEELDASSSVPDEVRHTSAWSFQSQHQAAIADPHGTHRPCSTCLARRQGLEARGDVRYLDVVTVHEIGVAYFCSTCQVWHPGRP